MLYFRTPFSVLKIFCVAANRSYVFQCVASAAHFFILEEAKMAGFLDELKSSTVSEADLKERFDRLVEAAHKKWAEETYAKLKEKIKRQVTTSDFSVVNGKTVVTGTFLLPSYEILNHNGSLYQSLKNSNYKWWFMELRPGYLAESVKKGVLFFKKTFYKFKLDKNTTRLMKGLVELAQADGIQICWAIIGEVQHYFDSTEKHEAVVFDGPYERSTLVDAPNDPYVMRHAVKVAGMKCQGVWVYYRVEY